MLNGASDALVKHIQKGKQKKINVEKTSFYNFNAFNAHITKKKFFLISLLVHCLAFFVLFLFKFHLHAFFRIQLKNKKSLVDYHTTPNHGE
jgi:hypothetical protein